MQWILYISRFSVPKVIFFNCETLKKEGKFLAEMTLEPLDNDTSIENGKCIVVSHQLPFVISISEDDEFKLTPRLGHAALYAGISSLVKHTQVLHIGWHGYIHDSNGVEVDSSTWSEEKKAVLNAELGKFGCSPVYLPLTVAIGHYEHYCKSDLWPLFHYILWDKPTNGVREKKR